MKSRKIVIIGLGSIGKRHLENIISLGYRDIVLIRPNGEQLVGYENLEVFKTIDEGCLKYGFENLRSPFYSDERRLAYKC